MSSRVGYSKYITFKARIGCYAALSISPLIEPSSRLVILLVALIVSALILFVEKPLNKRKILFIWLMGIVSSIFIVKVTSIFFIQLILYIVGIIVATALFQEMAENKAENKGPE
jgi:hypothetical protein